MVVRIRRGNGGSGATTAVVGAKVIVVNLGVNMRYIDFISEIESVVNYRLQFNERGQRFHFVLEIFKATVFQL